MKIHRALAFAVLLAAPPLAPAQVVYKCIDKEGHPKYSQSRCHDEPPAPPKPAEPEAPVPDRVEKASPDTRAGAAPAAPADPSADPPLTDSMGRPDVTQISKQKKP